MALIHTLRNGVAAVDRVARTLQVGSDPAVGPVLHEAWIGTSAATTPSGLPAGVYGDDTAETNRFAPPVEIQAIVEWGAVRVDTKTGTAIQTLAKITIPRAIAANGAPGRNEPFDDRDRITLPGGRTGPIVAVEGLIDPGTGLLLMTEMWLGKGGGGL